MTVRTVRMGTDTLKTMIARLGIAGILLLPSLQIVCGQQHPAVSELVRQFTSEPLFFRQFEIAKQIVAANDKSVLVQLEPWLTSEDRHARGNAAFIFARLGDPRGFDAIVAILRDYSGTRKVDLISSVGLPSPELQVREDRYYAAHLLGDLKDPRAIPILVPLLKDSDVNYIVPWSLGQIGDPSAIPPLIQELSGSDTNMRVLAVYALADLRATEALPRLRQLLADDAKSNFGKLESVADAAQAAIDRIQSPTRR